MATKLPNYTVAVNAYPKFSISFNFHLEHSDRTV